jgi:hypothetical protein
MRTRWEAEIQNRLIWRAKLIRCLEDLKTDIVSETSCLVSYIFEMLSDGKIKKVELS